MELGQKKGIVESDRDLIRACRAGRADAWRRLLKKYERLVFAIPLRYGLSREDAADITQLTFTVLIQAFDNLSEEGNLGGWLATVAHRHAWRLLDQHRRESAIEYVEELVGDDEAGHSDESIEGWELSEWLKGGLLRLNGPCRELLAALYFRPESPSYAEIASHLGVPVGSIGPTRARCLNRLRQALWM